MKVLDGLKYSKSHEWVKDLGDGEALIFRVDGRYVAKKFEIPLDVRRYRRPWLAEDACLRRLDGAGAPRTCGWFEETEADQRVVWLVKEFVAGDPLESFAAADLPAAAAELEARAEESRIRLRRLYGSQAVGFTLGLSAGITPELLRGKR